MSDTITNPHDSFFKEIFSRPEHARDFLQNYLPADLLRLLDLSSLKISKDTFVDPELQQHFSDLLYEVKLPNQSVALVYLLFEHKSYPEPYIAFQLLRYMTRIWEQLLKQKQPLAPILPLVLYHGRSRWTVSPHFRDLFDLPEALRPYFPDFSYQLYDLSRYDEEQLKGQIILQVVLRLLKYSLRPEINDRLSNTLALLRQLAEKQTVMEYLYVFVRYLSQGVDQVDETVLQEAVMNLLDEGDEFMPTLAEKWKEEGIAIGLEQGREEGREEGREATLKILRRFLTQRFGIDLDHFDELYEQCNLQTLDRLSDIAFEAESLADFETRLSEMTTT